MALRSFSFYAAFPVELLWPRHLFTDPFSSPIPSWGDVTEADSEAIPMVPLRRHRSCFFDDGPHSEIREGDLADMRRKYAIHPSVGMRSPSEFERAPNGGPSDVAIYEAYLEASFRGGIPYRGIRGNYPFGDGWNNRYVFVKIQEPFGYPTSWRTVIAKLIMRVPRRFRWVTFLVSKEALRHSRIWGNMVRLSVSAIYDEHQKAKTWKRCPFYTPPPRLARAASSVNGLTSTPSTGAEDPGAEYDGSPGSVGSPGEGIALMGAHEGMAGEEGGALGS
ncbi:hypothetical protein F2Q69_00053071 [Brassica cretica]|uniref:Uncharacterized protein n=1 Tax=Brassica cretica TaxID=69181 RepID=A0A8S9MYZ9_BRACR|nr:hypothetical protein F2Q69_00053071 [Brassica cretica]